MNTPSGMGKLKTAWLLFIVVLYLSGIISMFFNINVGLCLWFIATLFGIIAYFQKTKNDRVMKKLKMEQEQKQKEDE